MKVKITLNKEEPHSSAGVANSSYINQTLDIRGSTLSADAYKRLLLKIEEIKGILYDS